MSSENFGESLAPERSIPVDASLVTGVLIMIPVMVFSTALGFFLNMWLFWTVPALAGLAVWAVLFSKVRSKLAEEREEVESDTAEDGLAVAGIDQAQELQTQTKDAKKSA